MKTEVIEVKPISTESAVECSKNSIDLLNAIKKLEIKDQSSYENMAMLLSKNKEGNKLGELLRKKITDPIDVARKAAMDLFRPVVAYYEEGEKIAKEKMVIYQNEQERIRKEKEDKLRREAEAEEARQRKIKEDQERQWREKEEAARKELEKQNALIAKAKNEKARAEAEAAAAKAKAEQEKAAAKAEERRIQAASVQVVAPTIASTVSRVAGVSTRKDWKAKVIDPLLIPRDYLIVDEQKLNKVANATKGALTIPGVQFYSVDVMASR